MIVGCNEGLLLGYPDKVGLVEGCSEGRVLGAFVGMILGVFDGMTLGLIDGLGLGAALTGIADIVGCRDDGKSVVSVMKICLSDGFVRSEGEKSNANTEHKIDTATAVATPKKMRKAMPLCPKVLLATQEEEDEEEA